MRVLERRPRAAALVDDQLRVGGVAMGPHPLAPGLHRPGELASSGRSAIAVDVRGVWTITSWDPPAGREAKRSGSAPRREARERVGGVGEGARAAAFRRRRGCRDPLRARGRGWAPTRAVQPGVSGSPPPGAPRPHLGRGALLMALAERALGADPCGAARRRLKTSGRSARPGARIVRIPVSWSMRISGVVIAAPASPSRYRASCATAAGPPRGRRGPASVSSGSRRRRAGGACGAPRSPGAGNGLIMSIGSGKTIVVFWLTPISSSVCR